MLDHMFGDNAALIARSLDLRMARQNLLAANIANAETPGYRALDMDFESALREFAARNHLRSTGAIQSTDSAFGEEIDIPIIAADADSLGNENNTVDLEAELSKADRNAMMFKLQAQLLSMRMKQLSEAMRTP